MKEKTLPPIRIKELNLTLTTHFLERCCDRKVAMWEGIISDLKGIHIPKRGGYKVYVSGNCYIIKNRVLITTYKKPTLFDRLVVKC